MCRRRPPPLHSAPPACLGCHARRLPHASGVLCRASPSPTSISGGKRRAVLDEFGRAQAPHVGRPAALREPTRDPGTRPHKQHTHKQRPHASNAQDTTYTQQTSGGRPCASKRRARRRVGPMGGGQRGVWLSVNSTQPLHAAGCAQKCREPTRDGGAISRARRARCGALSASVGLRVGRCPISCAGGVRCGAPACANAPGPARFCDPSPHVRVTALPCGTGRVARVRGSPLSLAGLSCSSHLATGLKKKKAKQMMP
mmetsp:Transcript_58157/g.159613  ORF Transcript_58157/g.159613 Transcript_58157/m.159613 type:complete len:256 (-) Transcript_58157:176-943(-)